MDEPDDDPLPRNIRRFAPWTWHWMDMVGIGLTISTGITAVSLILWWVGRWLQ